MRTREQNLKLGLTLVLVGTVYLLNSLGVRVFDHLWKGWPLVLVAYGAIKLSKLARGERSRLGAPERLLLTLVAFGGLLTTLTLSHRSSEGRSRTRQAGSAAVLAQAPAPPVVLHEVRRVEVDASAEGLVEITVAGADVDLKPSEGATVTAVLAGDSSLATEALKADRSAGSTTIHFERDGGNGSEALPRAEVRITVPRSSAVTLHHRGGALRARDLGPLTVRASNSRMTFDGMRGTLDVEVVNGGVIARDVTAETIVRATYSPVRIEGAHGLARITCAYGDIILEGATAGADLTGNDGEIVVEGAQGPVQVHAVRATVRLEGIAGATALDLVGSTLAAEGITGNLVVAARLSTLNIEEVHGSVDVKSTSSPTKLQGVHGPVRAHSEDGDLTVTEATGPVDATVVRGSLHLSGTTGVVRASTEDGDLWAESGSGSQVTLASERGNVTLTVGQARHRLDLRAEPGRILSDPAAGLEVKASGANAVLVSTAASPVKVVTHHGFIRLVD